MSEASGTTIFISAAGSMNLRVVNANGTTTGINVSNPELQVIVDDQRRKIEELQAQLASTEAKLLVAVQKGGAA